MVTRTRRRAASRPAGPPSAETPSTEAKELPSPEATSAACSSLVAGLRCTTIRTSDSSVRPRTAASRSSCHFTWYSFAAPAGTPQELVSRLNTAIVKTLQMPDIEQRFQAQGALELLDPGVLDVEQPHRRPHRLQPVALGLRAHERDRRALTR